MTYNKHCWLRVALIPNTVYLYNQIPFKRQTELRWKKDCKNVKGVVEVRDKACATYWWKIRYGSVVYYQAIFYHSHSRPSVLFNLNVHHITLYGLSGILPIITRDMWSTIPHIRTQY